MWRRWIAVLLALTLLSLPCAALGEGASAAPENPASDAPESYVFMADSQQEAEEIAAAYGAALQSFSYGVGVLVFPEAASEPDGLSLFSALPPLYPNRTYYLCEETTPQSNPNDTDFSKQWQHTAIDTAGAWAKNAKGENTVIAILDTGLNLSDDFVEGDQGNVLLRKNFTGDGMKYYDHEGGDGQGHGTHVAGIAAARANNSFAGAGVAPNASVIALRVFSLNNSNKWTGSTSTITSAINYCIERGDVDIINMSLGGGGDKDDAFELACNAARDAGILVVVAAGNIQDKEEGDLDKVPSYPASFDSVLCVSATDSAGVRASYSYFGSAVDICAPGSSLFSNNYNYTSVSNQCIAKSGTSMATPVVAGVAALVLSAWNYPELSAQSDSETDDAFAARKTAYNTAKVEALTNILQGTAGAPDDPSTYYGAGLVNAAAAVSAAITASAATSLTIEEGETAVLLKSGPAYTFTSSILPVDATQPVNWKSDQPDVVSVVYTGKTSVKSVGAATLTVTSAYCPWLSDSISVTVVDVPASLTLLPGQTASFSDGSLPSSFSPSVEGIITLDASGAATGLKAGATTFAALNGDATVTVLLSPPAKAATFNKGSLSYDATALPSTQHAKLLLAKYAEGRLLSCEIADFTPEIDLSAYLASETTLRVFLVDEPTLLPLAAAFSHAPG